MRETAIPYEIRWANAEEWAPAMRMIWKTFLQYDSRDYTEEGVKNFFEFITDDDLYRSFLRGEYQMLVALDDDCVIGAASVRSHNHLSLLFVDERYHRQGIGRALMEQLGRYLKQEAGEKYMSLNAAPYAVNFYRKLGFRAIRPELVYSGIRITPMEKLL